MKNYNLMRPREMYAAVLKQREVDAKDFFYRYNKEFVKVVCPACQSRGRFSFKKYGFTHRTCDNCRTIFCSPRPKEELLTIYYNRYESPRIWTELLIKADSERKALQYKPRVQKIISIIKQHGIDNRGVVLDLGVGSGAFSVCLKNTGFFQEVIALDLSQQCVQACINQGLNAKCGDIREIESNSVDLICANDLIEHLFNPYFFLKECLRVLRKDGYISIATPNGEGFDFKILKDKAKNISPPEHLTYFNTHSLNFLLSSCGFRTVFLETPGKLDVEIILKEKSLGYSLKKQNEYIDYLLKQDTDVLKDFQKFLSENKLSSHILALAQKND